MAAELTIPHIDRATGTVREEQVYAGRFLHWSYNTWLGFTLTRWVLSHPLVSHVYGWYNRRSWSKGRIAPFIRQMGVVTDELIQPLDSYRCFNDFFIRNIDLSRRPIDPDSCTCVAPVDSRILAYQTVSATTPMQVKRHLFTMSSLLRDDRLAKQYDGGAVVVCRLSLSDYHHVHFPDSGVAHTARSINGSLYAGGSYALRYLVPFYSENYRTVTHFESDHFGSILLVEVGAFTVGSIRQTYEPDRLVGKGDHKGYFELGGSTVVLLFQPRSIVLDSDLVSNTCRGVETYVRMGERIGVTPEAIS